MLLYKFEKKNNTKYRADVIFSTIHDYVVLTFFYTFAFHISYNYNEK